MRATPDDYTGLLLSLRPSGPAWPQTDPVLSGLAVGLSRAHNRALDVVNESDPRSTLEMLGGWERQAGLPDTCSAGVSTTVQERRSTLVEKLTARGGASIAYLASVASRLGYQGVTFTEFRPFTCGRSRCGDRLGGPGTNRHYLRVDVPGPRVTRFRCGVSRCGDSLGKIARAEDLECRLRKVAGAHISLIFSYNGA